MLDYYYKIFSKKNCHKRKKEAQIIYGFNKQQYLVAFDDQIGV